jgi:hypothetical protein
MLRTQAPTVVLIYYILNSERQERQRERRSWRLTTRESEADGFRLEWFFVQCLERRREELAADFGIGPEVSKREIIEMLLSQERQNFSLSKPPRYLALGRCQYAGQCKCKQFTTGANCATCGHSYLDHFGLAKQKTPVSALSAGMQGVGRFVVKSFKELL